MASYINMTHKELLIHSELVHHSQNPARGMSNKERSILIAALEKQTSVSVFAALKAKKPTAEDMAGASLSDFGI